VARAIKKVAALLNRVGSDGHVRGSFSTTRPRLTLGWIGPQPQNLKKPETDDVAAAITAVLTGDYDHVRSPHRVLSLLGDLSRS
jgi:hypothetical protein